MYPDLIKQNRRMSTCNRLDLQTLGSRPVVPKTLPNQCTIPCDPLSRQAMFPIGSSFRWVSLAVYPLNKSCPSRCRLLQRLIRLVQMSTLFGYFAVALSKL